MQILRPPPIVAVSCHPTGGGSSWGEEVRGYRAPLGRGRGLRPPTRRGAVTELNQFLQQLGSTNAASQIR